MMPRGKTITVFCSVAAELVLAFDQVFHFCVGLLWKWLLEVAINLVIVLCTILQLWLMQINIHNLPIFHQLDLPEFSGPC